MKIKVDIKVVSVGEKTSSKKFNVVGLVLDDLSSVGKNGIIKSGNIFACPVVDFWLGENLVSVLSQEKVTCRADVSVNKANALNVRVSDVFTNGKFEPISVKEVNE